MANALHRLKREYLLGLPNPNTRRNFEGDIRSLEGWFTPWKGKESNLDIIEYVRALENDGLKASTIRGRVIRLRKLYEFLRLKGYRKGNPVELTYAPKVKDHRAPKCPDVNELKRIFKQLHVKDLECLRDSLIVSLLFYEALRVHEVVALNKGHISLMGKRLLMEVHGKGGRIDNVFLFPQTEKLIKAYLKSANHVSNSSPLIYSLRKPEQRITTRAVRKRIDGIFKKAKVRPGLSAHSLRHCHASILAAQGYPLTGVQKRLRHSSPLTTLKYYYHDMAQAYPKSLSNPAKLLKESIGL